MAIMSLETYSQIPQTNNLISYYPFLGNLEDQSGENHNTGSVDDVRIWNVALTNTEVSNLYTYENNAANDFSLPPITPFVTTWQTDGSNNIIIPLTGGSYDFTIDWGDGTTETKTGTPGNISHTYSTAGVKTVSITPNIATGFPRIYVNNFGNRNLLQTIESWGSGQWGASVDRTFYGAANLEVNATDIPDFSATTNFQYMFLNCSSVTGTNGFTNWTLNTNPTATISFSNMFQSATLFNGDISNWDVSRVNTFDNMFNNAASFNQNIGSWNVANATNMSSMFKNADAFNIDISAWDVSLVTNMTEMFSYNDLFNKNLSNWNVSSVTNMNFMFFRAANFNSPLNWGNKTGNVTNMSGMFKEAVVFNQDIGNWDVSSVTNLGYMFRSAIAFNKDLSNWDVSNVTIMAEMFYGASGFNSPLNWGNKTASVTNMSTMFYGASTFNQDLNSWNVSSVISFGQMFHGAQAFNENISNWQFTTDVTKTISMASMFRNASSFNQNISGWNVKRVNQMQRMFQNTPFNQDISSWDISRVSNLQYFLSDAKLSRANYNALLLGWSTLDAGESQVPVNLNAHFGNSKYSDTAAVLAARNTTLIANKNWTITDGGMDADVILPEIASNALASDNTTINITFSENVYRTDVSSGVLETTDFLFSLSGGTATLNSSIPNSITTTTNLTFELGLDINGTPDGTEVLTVTPVLNAIFDSSGNAATTTQSNNTAQLNDVTVPPITAPTTISGTATICTGDSTSLTASGGTTNSDAIDVWYSDICGGDGFHEGWETQPYGSVATTDNANANGVLNITSTSGDPYINMLNLGSFDPTLYKYINFRYKVNSGTATAAQIFFLNGAMTLADGAKYKNTPLISDGQWHTAVVDMSTHPLWASDGNITGIRYDYTTASGVTMDLDFIELSSAPIVGTGNTITVSPTANTSYYVNRKGPETNTSCISQLVTVNQIPVITNFNNYSKTYFDESFTIANPTSASAGSFSYTSDNASVATISGNTVTITGVGTANITATQAANGSFCSNTATVPLTVNGVSVVTKYCEISATNSNYVNNYGEIGDITGVSKNGLLLVTKSPFSGGTFDGYTYNVVTTATGRVWLDRNLGATQVASSSTDAASFGDLYQWGRGTDGHEKRTSTNISTVSTTDTPGHGFFINANSFNWQSPVNTELWQGVDGKNNPCPNGFRLPTIEEFEAEVVLWSSQNAAGALASSLKLPIAGRRHTNGSIYSVGSNGMYRTNSTLILNITSTSAARAGDERIDGFCVRCIKD